MYKLYSYGIIILFYVFIIYIINTINVCNKDTHDCKIMLKRKPSLVHGKFKVLLLYSKFPHRKELNKRWQVFWLCRAGYLGTKFLAAVQRLLQLISCTEKEREIDQIICIPQGR